MSDKNRERSVAFTIRLPMRCVQIVDELFEAGVYPCRGPNASTIFLGQCYVKVHKKMLPEK